jgi:hypothetical protein
VTQVDHWPLAKDKHVAMPFSTNQQWLHRICDNGSLLPSSTRPPSTQHDDTYNQIQTRVFDPTGSETHVIARQADITSLL